jgi:glycosyltransferase involved in cell wall biosynthesis
MLMPGGKAELLGLASDVASAWRRKMGRAKGIEPQVALTQRAANAGSPAIESAPGTPRVSVILTVYKRTEYLGNALSSILAQSYSDYEVIVADDSGTGASREIVEACGHPERIKYLPNPETVGVATSLARAVAQARGELIAILNDDDIWEKDFLAELAQPLVADPNRVLAFCDHWLTDDGGRIDHALSEIWSASFARAGLPEGVVRDAAEFVVKRGVPIAVAALFRKDAFDWALVTPNVTGAYDYWIACLLAATGRPIFYVPKRLSRWRTHREMETRRRSHDKAENLVYIFSTMRERGWFPSLGTALKAKLAEALFVAGRDKLHYDLAREARSCFWRSFCLSFRPKALSMAIAACMPGIVRTGLRECLGVLRKGTGLGSKEEQNPFRSVRPTQQ